VTHFEAVVRGALGATLLFLFGTAILAAPVVQAQPPDLLWATSAGGSSFDSGKGIAVDSSGNAYVTGEFSGTVDFEGTSLTSNAGSEDVFVAKYDANGNLLWATSAGGSDTEIGFDIAVDGAGNAYVTGEFSGTVDFDGTSLSSDGDFDIFVAKYDAGGNFLWANSAGGSGFDRGRGIAVDSSGNGFVTGRFSGTADFNGTSLSNAGGGDVFVAKYDASGNLLWATSAGGTESDAGLGIAVDSSGNAYVTGGFGGTADFEGTSLTSNAGSEDVFVAKYDASGNLLWATSAGGSSRDFGLSVAVDSSGNAYVTGEFEGTADFNGTSLGSTGVIAIFVAKYDASGNLLWATSAGGGGFDHGRGIAVDSSGNAFVTGRFSGTADFNGTSLSSAGNLDVFVAKYHASGNLLWATSAGGLTLDEGNGIAVDSSGNAYVTGEFEGTASFDGTSLIAGFIDIFVAKYNCVTNCPIVGGDPPLWGDTLIFPTPETFLGRDLNGDFDTRDAVLRIQNVRTGELTNTGIPVSQHHRAVDLYENHAVFVTQESGLTDPFGLFNLWGSTATNEGPIGVLNVETGEVRMLDVWGTRPTIHEDVITISGRTLRYYDLDQDRLVNTGLTGTRPAVWGEWIVYERQTDDVPTLQLYHLPTGGTQSTGIAGAYPAIHEGTVAFTTEESWVDRDLNGDGDTNDTVVRAYDVADDRMINTGQAGVDPAIYGHRIVFSQGRSILYHDLSDGRTYATGQLGAEPDIYEETVTSYVWEGWVGADLSGDRDQYDPIVQTHTVTDADRALPQPHLTAEPQPTPLALTQVFSHRQANGVRIAVQGEGIERMQLSVYDLSGQRVYRQSTTETRLTWRLNTDGGHRVANGVYLYLVTAYGVDGQATRSEVRKLVVLR